MPHCVSLSDLRWREENNEEEVVTAVQRDEVAITDQSAVDGGTEEMMPPRLLASSFLGQYVFLLGPCLLSFLLLSPGSTLAEQHNHLR